MDFVSQLRKTTLKSLESVKQHRKKLSELTEGRDRSIYKDSYIDDLIKEEQANTEQAISEGKKAIQALTDSYKREIAMRYTPDGAQLTEDAALLSSGIKLNAEDLKRLCEKNKGNLTMQRLIYEYANENGISLLQTYFSEEDTLGGVDTMAKYAVSALDSEWREAIITNDDYFSKIIPVALKEY